MSRVLTTPTLVYEVIPDHFAPSTLTSTTSTSTSTQSPLRAIIEHLPHLASLGVDGLALTPLFPGHDALRLHTSSFEGIDPTLGNEDDLVALCAAAQTLGIHVVAMGVFDHVSDTHPWFVAAREQVLDDRRVPPEERTRAFFSFSDDLRHGYACRDGSAREPELDLAQAEVRRRLFTGEDSVVHRFMELGLSGWRILRAEQVGYSILRELQRAVRTVEGSHFVVGDIKGFADRYQRDGLLDAVVNHYAREAVLAFLKGEIPARQLARVERDLQAAYGKSLARAWMPLSDHDTPRLPGLLPDGARVRLATLLGYTLPGCAHVLFGEEVGIAQTHRLPATTPMVWDEALWDRPTLALHRRLGSLRQARGSLRTGDFVDLTPDGEYEIFAFARVTPDPRETVIVVVNRSERPQVRKLFAPMSDLTDGLTLRDVLAAETGGRRVRVRSGSLHLEVEPAGAVLLVPDDEDEAMRRFFRGY
jgi:glycosidase